jgi:hypothetical protein
MFAAKEQRVPFVPQDLRCLIQTTVLNSFSNVDPVIPTATANVEFLIIPPELKTAEGSILVVPDPNNTAGIKQLFYLGSVFDIDFSHL